MSTTEPVEETNLERMDFAENIKTDGCHRSIEQVFFMLTKRLHFAITFQNLDKYVLRFRQIVLRFRQIVLVVKRAGRAWRGGEVCKQ